MKMDFKNVLLSRSIILISVLELIFSQNLSKNTLKFLSDREVSNDLNLIEKQNEEDLIVGASSYHSNSYGDLILPGTGYSTDSERSASATCYNYITMQKTNQQSSVRFDSSISFESLLDEFKVSSKLEGKYKIYKGNASMNFLRSIKNSDYSISLNYFQKISNTVSFSYSYDIDNILNEQGKKIYDDGKNRMFRILCGDQLIKSYEEGAGLIISLVVKFHDTESKKHYGPKFEAGLGAFANVTADISSLVEGLNSDAIISVKAYQYGGNPIELGKILSGSVSSCSVKSPEDCNKIIENLVSYASKEFSTQFKKGADDQWANALVFTGSIEKDIYLADINAIIGESYVDKEVKEVRNNFLEKYNKAYYYYSAIVETHKDFSLSTFSYSKYENSLKILIKELDEGETLWKMPNRAVELYNNIMEKINYDSIINQVEEFTESFRYVVHYNDVHRVVIQKVGEHQYICNANLSTLCVAFNFSIFNYYFDLGFVTPSKNLFTSNCIFNQSTNKYEGFISNKTGLSFAITGNLEEHRFSIKSFKEIDDETFIH